MLIWLYTMFYLLSFYTQTSVQKPLGYTTEHVRVGCTPVGLSWTRFNSLLTAFVHGLSHKPGSSQPSQVCSSDLSLVSNEPVPVDCWKIRKKQKKQEHPVCLIPSFISPWHRQRRPYFAQTAMMLHCCVSLFYSCPVLEFHKQQEPFYLSQIHSYSSILSSPVISFSSSTPLPLLLFLTHALPYPSAFVSLKLV